MSRSPRASSCRTAAAISDLVIGPFGAAVVRELPPAAVTRVRGGHLAGQDAAVAGSSSRTRSSAQPRDAERARRWLADDDADFLVKVYAAVVGPRAHDRRVRPNCAVLDARPARGVDHRAAGAAQPDARPPRAGPRVRCAIAAG